MSDGNGDRPQTLSLGQLLAKQFPPQYFVASHGLIGKNSLTFLYGPSKAYKSFILTSMAYDLVLGTNVFGTHRTLANKTVEKMFLVPEPQRVLIFEQEIGEYDLKERMGCMYNAIPDPAAKRLLFNNVFIHSCDIDLAFNTPEGAGKILSIIHEINPTVVCFDPLFDFHNVNENDAQAMGVVLNNLFKIKMTSKCAIIMSHHTGKPDATKARSGPDLMRGSSVIFQKGDTYIGVQPINRNAGLIRLSFTIRRGKPVGDMKVRIDWDSLRTCFHEWQRDKKTVNELIMDETPIQ